MALHGGIWRFCIGIVRTESSYSALSKNRSIFAVGKNTISFAGEDAKVRFLTMHASKGLEFPLVAIMGGRIAEQAKTDVEAAKLLYVAMTCATSQLVMTAAGDESKQDMSKEACPHASQDQVQQKPQPLRLSHNDNFAGHHAPNRGPFGPECATHPASSPPTAISWPSGMPSTFPPAIPWLSPEDTSPHCSRRSGETGGLQAGLSQLEFSEMIGFRRDEYFAAVRAGFDRNYLPMKNLFRDVIERSVWLWNEQ